MIIRSDKAVDGDKTNEVRLYFCAKTNRTVLELDLSAFNNPATIALIVGSSNASHVYDFYTNAVLATPAYKAASKRKTVSFDGNPGEKLFYVYNESLGHEYTSRLYVAYAHLVDTLTDYPNNCCRKFTFPHIISRADAQDITDFFQKVILRVYEEFADRLIVTV